MKRTPPAWRTGVLALLCALSPACRCTRTSRVTLPASMVARDAGMDSTAALPRPLALDGSAVPPEFGPPNPWGDGALPTILVRGPEADLTRTRMTALRAIIGFWRIDQRDRARCPTVAALESSPRSGFRAGDGTDGWGRPLELQCQGARVRLHSWGPDGLSETPDDLWSN